MDLSNKRQSFIELAVIYIAKFRVLTGSVCINMTLITDVCDYRKEELKNRIREQGETKQNTFFLR